MGPRAVLLRLVLAAATRLVHADRPRNASSLEVTGCYLRLETLVGYLDSPNYPGEYPVGMDCCYDIARPSQRHCGIALYAETFNVMKTSNDGDFCLSDWFVMSSCVPEGGSRHCGNLTGTTFYYLFQPGSRAMRFIFHSSNLPRHKAVFLYRYRIRYHVLTDCVGLFQEALVSEVPNGQSQVPCYTRITARSGSINTPYHPGYYPKNVDCVYEFFRSDPFICGVHMRSKQFHLEPSVWTPLGDACSDYLQAPGCGFMCGKTDVVWTALYQPGATSQKFHFHSDDANSMPGFVIMYEQLYQC